MSDSSQIICVPKILNNNIKLAEDFITRLQEEKIIEMRLSDCTLNKDGYGYAISDNIGAAVLYPDEPESLSLNGIKAITNPAFYCDMEFNPQIEIYCPHCEEDQFKDLPVADYYADKFDEKQSALFQNTYGMFLAFDGSPLALICEHCKKSSDLSEFDFKNWLALSNLTFECYNWGDLKNDFVSSTEAFFGEKINIFVMRY